MAAIVRQIRGIGRARCRITTDRDMGATGAIGHRTIAHQRLFVIPLITAREPGLDTTGLSISRVTVHLQTGAGRRSNRSSRGRQATVRHRTDRRRINPGGLIDSRRPNRPRRGLRRIGLRRTGLRRIGLRRIGRHHRRDRRRKTDRRVTRIGRRTSRDRPSKAGAGNGGRASREFAVVPPAVAFGTGAQQVPRLRSG